MCGYIVARDYIHEDTRYIIYIVFLRADSPPLQVYDMCARGVQFEGQGGIYYYVCTGTRGERWRYIIIIVICREL